ncbi:MAG TPA: sensor histidine kinase [Naasia sp.]
MESPKWWSVAVTATAVALTVVLAISDPPTWRLLGGIAALAAFVLAWFAIGRRGCTDRVPATVFVVLVILITGAAVAFWPTLAVLQVVSYPIAWVFSATTRQAIVANIGVALATAVGFVLSRGTSQGAITETIATVVLSFGFSMAMGAWISRISHLSEERGLLIAELTAAQEQLAALGHEAGAASERQRLSRELHDTIAQSITGFVLLTQQARQELRAGDTAAVAARLRLLEESARETLVETRALVAATAPVELEGGGVVPALERIAARFERETGIEVSVRAVAPPSLPREAEVVLLRCAQEALANVRKHAGAGSVRLELTDADGLTRLTVTDDGTGFDPAAPATGFGLAGMRDRLALADGSLDITSGAGGTTLTALLPHPVRA